MSSSRPGSGVIPPSRFVAGPGSVRPSHHVAGPGVVFPFFPVADPGFALPSLPPLVLSANPSLPAPALDSAIAGATERAPRSRPAIPAPSTVPVPCCLRAEGVRAVFPPSPLCDVLATAATCGVDYLYDGPLLSHFRDHHPSAYVHRDHVHADTLTLRTSQIRPTS